MIRPKNRPATKADLDNLRSQLQQDFASKADLNTLMSQLQRDFASKADLNNLSNELNTKIDRVAADLVITRNHMATKEDISEIRQDIERMYRIVLDAAEKGRTYFEKALSHGDMLQDHETKLKNYDRRLIILESRT